MGFDHTELFKQAPCWFYGFLVYQQYDLLWWDAKSCS